MWRGRRRDRGGAPGWDASGRHSLHLVEEVPHGFRVRLMLRVADLEKDVVSPVAQNLRPFWTPAFSPPWISPASPRSFRIRAGYFTRWCPSEDADWNVPRWTNDSPTTFTCMRTCIRAWAGSSGVPSPAMLPPRTCLDRASIHATLSYRPRSALCKRENLSSFAHVFYSIAPGAVCQAIWIVVLRVRITGQPHFVHVVTCQPPV
jgi:hypothetical protein